MYGDFPEWFFNKIFVQLLDFTIECCVVITYIYILLQEGGELRGWDGCYGIQNFFSIIYLGFIIKHRLLHINNIILLNSI